MDWLNAIFGSGGATGGLNGILGTIKDGVKMFVKTPEDELALQKMMLDAEFEAKKLEFQAQSSYLRDVQSARELYKSDSSVQKKIALAFIIAYFGLIGVVMVEVSVLLVAQVSLPDWANYIIVGTLSAMSMKVGTILDFYFGSSKGSRDKDDQMTEAMRKLPTAPSS